MAFLDETGLAEVWSLANGKFSKIAMGSYTGTGKGGSATPTRLTVDFEPKIMFLYHDGSNLPDNKGWNMRDVNATIVAKGQTAFRGYSGSQGNYAIITWGVNYVEWYSVVNGDAGSQANYDFWTYRWILIG